MEGETEGREDFVSSDEGEEDDEESDPYRMIDDLALGVMQSNAELLARQREEEKEKLGSDLGLVVRFDVSTPNNREQHGAHCVIDLKQLVKVALAQNDKFKLPSRTCYIDEIAVEDSMNSLPVDVHVSCKQDSKTMGSFVKGSHVGGDVCNLGPALWVAHANSSMHCDSGRTVYTASDFVKGDKFQTYLQALKKNVEDSVTEIKGGEAVEYLSPWALLNEENVIRGDWFVDIMYKNARHFGNIVQAIRTPVAQSTDYVVGLRMHTKDWESLQKAVNTTVVTPLRRAVLDLDTDPDVHFILTPVVPNATNANNHTKAWRHESVHGQGGRAVVCMRATVKFV